MQPSPLIRIAIPKTDLVGSTKLTICSSISKSLPRPSTRRATLHRAGHAEWRCRRFRPDLCPGRPLDMSQRQQEVLQLARCSASQTRKTFPQIECRSCATKSRPWTGQCWTMRASRGYLYIYLGSNKNDTSMCVHEPRPDSAPLYS